MPVTLARMTAAATLMLLTSFMTVAPAVAHGEGETNQGYLLVQQALGHLAHDTGAVGIELAMEKVQDALDTNSQRGVDVVEVRRGMEALKGGHVSAARSLLQDSIKEALADLPPATGNQTGTKVLLPELPGRSALHGQDWVFLIASVLAGLLGVWLALRFRPHDSVRDLRSGLTTMDARSSGRPDPGREGADHGKCR